MAAQRYPLDRSAAFTALIELDPEGFGKQDMNEGGNTVTAFLGDWYRSDSTNMYEYAREWVAGRQEAAQRAPEAPGDVQWFDQPAMKLGDEQQVGPVPESPGPEEGTEDGRVTAQVSRSVQGWGSSRQVPTFTIPRWAAPTREDAEAKALEIINPFGERYAVHLDIWPPGEREPQAQAQSDAEAWGPRGPSASREKWKAEGCDLGEDVRPGEKLREVPGDQERGQ